MSENNLPNEEFENENTENTFETEEVVEEGVEAVEEETEEVVEEASEEFDEELEIDEEAVAAAYIGEQIQKAEKAAKTFKTSAIIAWILVIILAAVDVWYYMTNIYNKYNHIGYLNVSGYTVGEVVSGMGMEFDEFKEMYGLPADMDKDTYMEAAQALIPIKKMAELNGMDFASLKDMYKFGDEVTEESTWGEAIDTLPMSEYVGEEKFEEFKTQYELGEEVTLDTKWGDVRKEVEKKQ